MIQKLLSNRILLIAMSLMLAVIGVIMVGLFMHHNRRPAIQGTVEQTEYRVSSKVPSRVLSLRVSEGDRVEKGDTLVILSAPDLQAKLTQVEGGLEAVHQQEVNIEKGTREETIAALHSQWQKAVAECQLAEKAFARTKHLHDEGVATEQRFDEVLARRDASRAAVETTLAAWQQAVNGARHEERAAAQAKTNQLKGVVAEVNSYLRETVLTASEAGTVAEVYPEEGELVGSGARIMAIATSDVYFTFNLTEDLLPGIRVGKNLNLYVAAIDETIESRVKMVKCVGNFATWKATRALGGYDLKVFEVQARPLKAHPALRAGMSVVVR